MAPGVLGETASRSFERSRGTWGEERWSRKSNYNLHTVMISNTNHAVESLVPYFFKAGHNDGRALWSFVCLAEAAIKARLVGEFCPLAGGSFEIFARCDEAGGRSKPYLIATCGWGPPWLRTLVWFGFQTKCHPPSLSRLLQSAHLTAP